MALIVGLHLVLPGLEKTGMPLPGKGGGGVHRPRSWIVLRAYFALLSLAGTTDKRLKYKLNGLLQFVVVSVVVSVGLATQSLNLAWCYHHTVELFTVRVYTSYMRM